MIRPYPAHWFEIVVAREDVGRLLDTLARAGAVELEAGEGKGCASVELLQKMQRYAALAERFGAFWPPPEPAIPPGDAEEAATRALPALEAWALTAGPLIEGQQALEAEREQLSVWREALSQIALDGIDFGALAAPGAGIAGALFTFPSVPAAPPLPPAVLGMALTLRGAPGLIAFGAAAALDSLGQQAKAAGGERMAIPAWARSSAIIAHATALERLQGVERDLQQKKSDLERLALAERLAEVLGWLRHAQWMLPCLHAVERGDTFCRLTGWTDDPARLEALLEGSGTRALARFPRPPDDLDAPLLLRNPWWARPFEVFSRALGMPARYAADPSMLLALIAPLLFGYMFGDIGQGAVLLVAGLVLRKRMPVLGMLVAGGVSAMVFGAVFGSVFGRHGIVPALWVEPLEEPLPVLLVPLVGGAVLMLAGLVINAVEAYWRHKLLHWLVSDAGLIAVYVGTLLGFIDLQWHWLAAAGTVLTVAGQLLVARRTGAALSALGNLLEKAVQLLINTLSFVRVGAFAMAHAGLSAAVIALAAAADTGAGQVAVLVLGNAFVIALEAMVVGIQTTRLVLFEFFTRFFISKGREFHPLPPVSLAGGLRESPS